MNSTFYQTIVFLTLALVCFITVYSDTSTTFYSTENDLQLEFRQDVIRNMTLEAWTAYQTYAWGARALRPVSREASHFLSPPGSGQTIIAALSTLHVMGLQKQFNVGKEWVEKKLNFTNINFEMNVYDSITEYIGGLLSVYALTGDSLFLDKATQIGNIIKMAFNSSTGLLYRKIIPKTKGVPDNSQHTYLSFTGHQQPELIFLTDHNNDTELKAKLAQVRQFIAQIGVPKGHFTYLIDVSNGQRKNTTSAFGQNAKDFYYNLLRSYLQSASTDTQSLQTYMAALQSIVESSGLIRVTQNGHVLVTYWHRLLNISGKSMEANTCYLGAMLSLGSGAMLKATTLPVKNTFRVAAERSQQLAVNLTESCHMAAMATNSTLLPNEFAITDEGEVNVVDEQSYLTQHLAESYFILWRLTHDQRYREYAWQLVEAIQQNARTESGGYGSVKNVNELPTTQLDYQPPEFFSGTLLYLFLTFSNDTVLPIDKWIFNAVGHPLPVCGQHQLYARNMCIH